MDRQDFEALVNWPLLFPLPGIYFPHLFLCLACAQPSDLNFLEFADPLLGPIYLIFCVFPLLNFSQFEITGFIYLSVACVFPQELCSSKAKASSILLDPQHLEQCLAHIEDL